MRSRGGGAANSGDEQKADGVIYYLPDAYHLLEDSASVVVRPRGGGADSGDTQAAARSLDELLALSTHCVVWPWSHVEFRRQLVAFDLTPWNVKPGDCIAMLVPNGPLAAAFLLSAMATYCVVPLNPNSPEMNISAALHRTCASCLVSLDGEKAAKAASAAAVPLVQLVPTSDHQGGFALPPPPASQHASWPLQQQRPRTSHDVALILQTSGTTSEPKLVPATQRRLIESGCGLARSMQLAAADVGLNMMPLHHIGGIACNLMAPVFAGSRIIYTTWSGAADWYAHIALLEPAVTWCYQVPSMWSQVLRAAEAHATERAASHVRLLRSGAAPLPHVDATRMAALFDASPSVLPTYSMTVRHALAAPNSVRTR